MADKILLPNGCSMSQPSVNPKNWKDGGRELLKKNWQVQYYFYDPEFAGNYPYGKLVAVRGMNDFKTLSDRRKVTQQIIDAEIDLCLSGYNHFTKTVIGHDVPDYEIEPRTGFIDALWKACDLMNVAKSTLNNVKSSIRHIEKAARQLRLHNKPVCEVQRRNVKACLDFVEKESTKPSNYRYNKNRAHLHMLFKTLVEYETVESNVVRDISKRVEEKKQREILTVEQFQVVRNHLKTKRYSFYRYLMIFFFAGARSTELLSVKKKDVNIEDREYKVLIKKGKQYVWETKPIILPAIPFWVEIINECKSDNDFLFSHEFNPGSSPSKNKKATRYWKKYVKDELEINADFYTLKHLFLDMVDEQVNAEFDVAQNIASHRSSEITNIYRTGKKKRELERLKNIDLDYRSHIKEN